LGSRDIFKYGHRFRRRCTVGVPANDLKQDQKLNKQDRVDQNNMGSRHFPYPKHSHFKTIHTKEGVMWHPNDTDMYCVPSAALLHLYLISILVQITDDDGLWTFSHAYNCDLIFT
jgi:hypothetical protein